MNELLSDSAREAKRLVDAMDDVAATALCLRLWHADADATALVHFLLPALVARHEPARAEFTKLRDALAADEHLPRLRWLQLSALLDDGLPVLRWLSSLDPKSEAARGIWSDERVQSFVEKHRAWQTFARHLDIDEIEDDLRSTLEDLSDYSPGERKVLFAPWTEPFDVPRKTLINVGRLEDEARLAKRIDSFVA